MEELIDQAASGDGLDGQCFWSGSLYSLKMYPTRNVACPIPFQLLAGSLSSSSTLYVGNNGPICLLCSLINRVKLHPGGGEIAPDTSTYNIERLSVAYNDITGCQCVGVGAQSSFVLV